MTSNVKILPPDPAACDIPKNVLDLIYEKLLSGRRYYGSAGASLTYHVNDPDYNSDFKHHAVYSGMSGERDTSQKIRKWMADKPEVVLFDSVHIKGYGKEEVDEETGLKEGGDTDHVLLIGEHLILIDTKRWRSRRKYTVQPDGTIKRGSKTSRKFGGGAVHAKQAIFLWKKYLAPRNRINSIICINNEKVFVPYDANWRKQPYRLVTIDKLLETLNYHYEKLTEKESGQTIDTNTVAKIATNCIKPFDSYEKVFNMDTLKDFK